MPLFRRSASSTPCLGAVPSRILLSCLSAMLICAYPCMAQTEQPPKNETPSKPPARLKTKPTPNPTQAAPVAAGTAPPNGAASPDNTQNPPPVVSGAPPTDPSGIPPVGGLKLTLPGRKAPAKPNPDKQGGVIGLGDNTGPIDITADNSLEIEQTNRVYIASGNAIAIRGNRKLEADTLMAYYREIPESSDTEIWRLVAEGHVRLSTPTQTLICDHAVYDLDTKTYIFTGTGLKLTTPRDVVTARDSIEWYEDKQLGVARGDALVISLVNDRRLRADTLTALVSQAPNEQSRISRIDGNGHVFISGPRQVGTGDRGVYNVDTGIATLVGHVRLNPGESAISADYGIVDLNKGISRFLPNPPAEGDFYRNRVKGYLVPKPRDEDGPKKPPKTKGDLPAPAQSPS